LVAGVDAFDPQGRHGVEVDRHLQFGTRRTGTAWEQDNSRRARRHYKRSSRQSAVEVFGGRGASRFEPRRRQLGSNRIADAAGLGLLTRTASNGGSFVGE